MNPAAERIFACERGAVIGRSFRELLAPESRASLVECTAELLGREQQSASLWIPGGLHVATDRGRSFRAEATLSQYSADRRQWFTLILRDVEERLAAERRIESLLSETESLRDELRALGAFAPILGSSPALLSTLREVASVAARLAAYVWPGNVRELANVLERGVIISKGGTFDIDRALLDTVPRDSAPLPTVGAKPARILSVLELEDLERANMVRALEASGWKVAGAQGAAALLGINPSTLNSRMRALGIARPPVRHSVPGRGEGA